MQDYQGYLSLLEQRLGSEGYTISKGLPVEPYGLSLVAAKSSWELSKFGKMTRIVLVGKSDKIGPDVVIDFSSKSTEYALDNRGSILPRGFGGSLLAVPVLVSQDFDETLKRWIQETPPKKHWAAFEFPVLVALGEQRMYYYKKTPLWGGAYYKSFRKFVDQRLDPRP